MSLMKKNIEMKHSLNNIKIVENIGDYSLVDIGDVVKIDMIFSETDREEQIFKLVGTSHNFD